MHLLRFLGAFFSIFLFGLCFCFSAKGQTKIDSLRTIEIQDRDSAWVIQSVGAAFEIMYSEPALAAAYLAEVASSAKQNELNTLLPRVVVNRGVPYDVMNKPDSALFFYREGLALAENYADTNMIASAFNNIGLIYWNQEKLDSARYFYHKAEVLFEKIGQLRGYTSTVNNIGLIYLSLDRMEDAHNYFYRVLRASAKIESKYFESIAYLNLAQVFEGDNTDSSLFYFKKAIEIQEAENNLWGLAKSYHNLASSLYFNGNLEESNTYLNKAIEINEKLENYHALASNYYQHAARNLIIGDFEKIEENLEKAQKLHTRYTDVDLKQKIDFRLALVKVRKYDKALYNSLMAAKEIRDSLHLAQMEGKAMELQKKYETEKKEQQLEIQALELEGEKRTSQNRLYAGIGIAFVLLLVIIGVFLLLRYRRKIQKLKNAAALEAERSRISKDLHDNVGAQLTSIAMRVNMMQVKMGDNDSIPELEKIKEEASQSVEVLRDTIWAIHQDVFDLTDFIKRVKAYALRILPEGLKCEIRNEVKIPLELNSLTALNLFRIIQEALQNVLKHSEADTVKICFSTIPGLFVSISDNGAGSTDFKNDNIAHYGLDNMRERAKDMSAKLQIESIAGKGFQLEISF